MQSFALVSKNKNKIRKEMSSRQSLHTITTTTSMILLWPSAVSLLLLALVPPPGAAVDPSTENCGHLPGTLPSPLSPTLSPTTVVDPTTLHSKLMAGYQGWFDTPCSSYKNAKWKHWAHRGGPAPDPTHYQFEMWPDLSEYDDDEFCPTGFTYQDGTNAGLFSSYNSKTVDRHVQWMADYGIDGVFLQRFLNQLDDELCFEDKVLDNIRTSSERYGRVFANMYDLGKHTDNVVQRIKDDWMYLVDVQEITQSPSYLYHRGRPLVSVWGFGVANRPGEPQEVIELIDWFHNNPMERYRATVKGGVPNGWQDLGASSKKEEGWAEAYRSFDVLSPWSVGRYKGVDGADDFARKVTIPNAAECEELGIDYMPVVWPGFSWSYKNLRYPDLDEPFNKYPRMAGEFFWRQVHNSLEAFSDTVEGRQVYVAMFDEVDEATSVMKLAASKAQIPTEGQFLTMDADGTAVPSDWYLQLMGKATASLRAEGRVPIDMPKLLPPVTNDESNDEKQALAGPSLEEGTIMALSMASSGDTQPPTGGPTSRPTADEDDAFVVASSIKSFESSGSGSPGLDLRAVLACCVVILQSVLAR